MSTPIRKIHESGALRGPILAFFLLHLFEDPSRKADQLFDHGAPDFLIVCIFFFKGLGQLGEKLTACGGDIEIFVGHFGFFLAG